MNRKKFTITCGLVIGLYMFANPIEATAQVIFQENFDELPDWTSGLSVNDHDKNGVPDRIQDVPGGYDIPSGWYSVRQDPVWAPSLGYPNGHENIEILKANADKAYGGTGKSMVVWRDSTTGPLWHWNSDGILSKYFPQGYDEIYVSFWVRFSPNWTAAGQSKIFRVAHWDGGTGTLYHDFEYGANAPIFLWDYDYNQNYGARDFLSFRADPQATNYNMTDPPAIDTPRNMNNGDMSVNFSGNIRDLNGDGKVDNKITSLNNLLTGDPIGSGNGIVTQQELWGTAWHKMEFYVKMNSAPGAMDGKVCQWMDGQLIFRNVKMPWLGKGSPGNIKWNVVHFGGNSNFHTYPDDQHHEEWYSIDNITIRSDLPSNRKCSDEAAPSAPKDLQIQ